MNGSKNVAASVAARLLTRARTQEEDYQFVLARYAIERLIWRLGRSEYAEAFVLKGAMMFLVWTGEVYRPTKDLDLLARASHTADRLKTVFGEICNVPVEDDGITFLAESIEAEQIREDQAYGGIRVIMRALIGKIRIPVQIDVGFGDAVTPDAVECRFPALLQESESPIVMAYPRESSIAEKLEAIVSLGMANSRMKDYYDIYVLLRRFPFDGDLLSAAVFATFKRLETSFPVELPLGLSDEFASDSTKLAQWKAFQRGRGFKLPPPELAEVVGEIRNFVLPPLKAAAEGRPFLSRWEYSREMDGRGIRRGGLRMDREEEKRRAVFRAFKSIVRVEGEELLLDGKVSARLKRQAVERGFTKSGGRLLRSLSPLERMVMRMRHANTGDSFNHEWWAEWASAPHWFKKFHEVFLEDWLFYPVEGVALDTREVGRKIGYELEYKRRKFERASADPQFIEQWKLAEFGPPEPPELPPELKGEKIVYTYFIGAYFTDWREYSLESLRKLRPLQQRIYRLAVRLEGDYPAFIKAMGEGAERAQGIDLDRDLTGNEERDHILRILERNFEVISQMRNRKEVADFILERLPVSVDRREFLKQPAQFRAFTERLRNTYFSKIDLRLAARGGPRKSEKSEPRRSRILLYTPEISSGSETQPE